MIHKKIGVLLLLLALKENCAQPTATVTPNGFNASLDPESSFTFQCDVTGALGIQWLIDGSLSNRQDVIAERGVSESFTVVNDATGTLKGNLSIPRNGRNSNTSITCVASNIQLAGVLSDPVLFKVQGLLDAPSNLILSEAGNQFMRRLSWEEPFSLDITDVEPDISYYRICYSFSNNTNESMCTQVDQTEFTFLYVNIPLLFTVSAENVVGEGDSASIPHDGTACSSTTGTSMMNGSQVQTLVSYSGNNPVVMFQFQQPLQQGNRVTCFPVYRIESSLLSVINTTDHGIQIPGVVQYSPSSVQLNLTVDSNLEINEQYSATITDITPDGERGQNVTTSFDTYDVQSVSGRALSAGLELSCTFAEGSQAQSCILTVCRIENAMEDYCVNLTITREGRQSGGQVTGLQPGLHVIRNVAEVERDGQVTVHGIIDVLEFTIEPSPATVSTDISAPPSVGGVSSSSSSNVGPIIGGVLGGICIVIIVIIVIIVAIMLVKNTQKPKKINSNLLAESEIDGTKRYSDSQIVEPTYDSLVPLSSRAETSATLHPQNHTIDTGTSDKDIQSQDENSKDSPTFPLYSDVMGKGYPPDVEDEEQSPAVPEMQLTADDLKKLNVPTDIGAPANQQQNPNTEEIQKADLSTETGCETNSEPTASKQPDDELQNVIESLLSVNPEKAQPTERGEDPQGPVYAELDHNKKKQSKAYVPDMTGVQYSEIKTDEKKSKQVKDQSTSDSPSKSAADSPPTLDKYDV